MSASGKLRIAFVNESGEMWTGGVTYLQNMFFALHGQNRPATCETVLLVNDPDSWKAHYRDGEKPDQTLCIPPEQSPSFWTVQRERWLKHLHLWQEPEEPLSMLLRREKVDVLFSGHDYGTIFKVPRLIWIPDFQHIHLPDMFKPWEIQLRNNRYKRYSSLAARIVLSSHNACEDFTSLYPEHADKARVLHFVARIPNGAYERNPIETCRRYHLPERFFFLPNQFWKHKNHKVVVKALALLRQTLPECRVVCTGNPTDYRNPQYLGELLREISLAGVRESFDILGFLPQDHLYDIMRQSISVLQPSLFEGWSTTVEEAKSLGKGMLLSDIPVHREQDPPGSVFFDPHNPANLADGMAKIFREKSPGPDLHLEETAQKQLPHRIGEFAQRFLSIAGEVVTPNG